MSSTRRPRCPATAAHIMPAAPAPITATSYSFLAMAGARSARFLLAATGGDALADDVREPRRIAPGEFRIRELQKYLAAPPSALGERQRLQQARGELLAD